jgi:hypothetical protein
VALAPVAVLLAAVAAPGTPAQAASADNYLVTFVARQCPTYQDITANLARNNIQESLQDLGADTAYVSGQPISPSVETPNQPNCTALTGWDFTFGDGINGVTPGTNLSRVSDPVSPPFTTQASVPLLDTSGNPTGTNIAGAVTTTLSAAQVTQAAQHQLWVQGGTPTDPLGNTAFPDRYAFGALRCAIDNLNGDNVEWAGFPSGQTHVFCYYYAVALPPKPGVITISKVLANAGSSTPSFPFTGSVSYNPGNTFDVPAGGSTSFTRDSNVDWNFQEGLAPDYLPPAGYTFNTAVCSSLNGDSTFSSNGSTPAPSATFSANGLITVDLAPGDTASCVYTDSRNVVDLTVLKQTIGGVGGPFPITVTTPGPPPPPPASNTYDLSATTEIEGVPVEACTSTDVCDVVDTPPSFTDPYVVTEQLPPTTPAGSWAVTAFDCNGVSQPPDVTQDVYASADNQSLACTFTNTFTPAGSIVITKTTVGGVGTTDFVVTPVPNPADGDAPIDPTQLLVNAVTTAPGVAVTATGDPLDQLGVGTTGVAQAYLITEEGPDDTASGTWAPQSISCTNAVGPASGATIEVALSTVAPQATCAFTNAFTATPPSPTTTVAPTTTTAAGGVAADETGTPGGTLAATGTDVRVPLGIGLVLVVTGGGLLVGERARRRPEPIVVTGEDDHPST